MILHHGPFLIIQTAGFTQDGIGNADLSDIVQVARNMDGLGLLLAQAQIVAQHAGHIAHPAGMVARIGIAGIHRVGDALHQVVGFVLFFTMAMFHSSLRFFHQVRSDPITILMRKQGRID